MQRRTLADRLQRPLRTVTLSYAVFAALWIYFSDAVLGQFVRDPAKLVALSVYKGLAFVAVTATLLWLLMQRLIGTVVAREAAERERHDTLVEGQQRILEGVAQGSALRSSLEGIVRFIEGQAPGMQGSILLLDSEGNTVRHGAGPSLPPEYMEAIDGAPIGPTAGSCGTAAFTREPVYVEDIETDPRWTAYKHLATPHGLRACWSTPIFDAEGRVLGTFAMYYRRVGKPTEDHRRLIDVATQLASIAISRARTEQALHESETRFVAFMDAAPAIAWVTDEQGRHQWMNKAWSAAFGMPRERFIGHRAEELVPAAVAARIHASDAEVLRTDAPMVIAEDRTEYNGEQRWWNTVKFPFRNAVGERFVGGVAIDITARKSIEQQLASLRARLEVVVENLQEGLIITDPEASFVHWNPAALRIIGYENTDEGRGDVREFSKLFDLTSASGVPLAASEWPLARVRRGEVLRDYEVRARRKGESRERRLSYSGSCVTLEDGSCLAFVTLTDVTQRRQQEQQLRDMNVGLEARVDARTRELRVAMQRAESADRMKSAFLATMSHELRTPLNSIIGFTGILLQQLAGPLNDEQRRQLEMVRGSARHLLALINDVLDISKIEAGQLEVQSEAFDLLPLLEHQLDVLRPQAERKGLVLRLDASAAPATLRTDRRRVEQVLLNLLTNAIKFTERGQVHVMVDTLPDYRRVPDADAVPAVRFLVRDTGIGIAERDLAELFQPFRQVDAGLARQHEGTGLGLSICLRLCELMRGEISVQSEPGRGSTFTVILPQQLEPGL